MDEIYFEAIASILSLIYLASLFLSPDKRERRKEFKRAAEKENYNFIGSRELHWLNFAESKYLSQGYFRKMSNLIESKSGHQTIWIADFSLLANLFNSCGFGMNITVCIIEDRLMKIPAFLLKTRRHKKGPEDEEVFFQENSGFSKKFILTASDEHLIRYLFNEEVMEFFNRYAIEDFIVEAFENKILLSKGWKNAPDTFPALAGEAMAIKEMLKKTVEKLELYS